MLHTLQNKHWQAGILPETGASIVFGRVRYAGTWVDILRPTDEANYDNSGKCSSFIMAPWANRIRDGKFTYGSVTYQLNTRPDTGNARHGDVRSRPWQVIESSETHIHLRLRSIDFGDVNWPFAFTINAQYELNEENFVWELALTNDDEREMPAGFGHHPYFVRLGESMPMLQIPADQRYTLINSMPEEAASPVDPQLDFRELRPVSDDLQLDDLLTGEDANQPNLLRYEDWGITLEMHADDIFKHTILFSAPDGSIAVEPQTNANAGVNLLEAGVEGHGVVVLPAGETLRGTVKLRLQQTP
jgi:aldose 1-epimerase